MVEGQATTRFSKENGIPVREVEFLTCHISYRWVWMSLSKVESVLRSESPKSVRDEQGFIWFANFYRHLISKNYVIAGSITKVTKGNCKKSKMSDKQEASLEKMKQLLTKAPNLCHFTPKSQKVVETDVSDYALGCVQAQVIEKCLHLVAFHKKN